MPAIILPPEPASYTEATRLLYEGELVAFPTETVYGLGADAINDAAVARIFAAKGRDTTNPLSLLVADVVVAETIALFDARAYALAKTFWPGPLTLVLPEKQPSLISSLVTNNTGTIGIRIPNHPVTLALLKAIGRPIVGTSANLSGQPAAVTASEVMAALENRVSAIIDGSRCDIGIASTIVDLTTGQTKLLREGVITSEQIEAPLRGRPEH